MRLMELSIELFKLIVHSPLYNIYAFSGSKLRITIVQSLYFQISKRWVLNGINFIAI